ncbi:MAG: helix-turn-helix transcriptional regulator [Tannerellaceae bacterium]|nr:helix-turn-helix transcriptional regulator [Tannerellaceae bacterium]
MWLFVKFFSPGLIREKEYFQSSFNPVEMAPLLWEYSRHLEVLFEEYVLTTDFLRIKIVEFFHILNFSYTKRELAGLFYPALTVEETFVRFVEESYPRFRTARELARESHMSLRSFENKFNRVFGVSPGRWILRRKIQMVYAEITRSSLPLSVIADKCGFATLSHMTDFCKKHLGATPSQIRKGRIL